SQLAHPAGVKALALLADGKVAATADVDGVILLWNTARGQSLNAPSHSRGAILSAGLSPDGDRAVLIDRAGYARVYSTKDGSEQEKEGPGQPLFLSAAYSPDGRTLALGRSSGDIVLHDARTFKEQRTLQGHARGVAHLLFTSDGKTLFSAGQDRRIRQWNTATGDGGPVIGGIDRQPTLSLALSSDGRRLFAADGAA